MSPRRRRDPLRAAPEPEAGARVEDLDDTAARARPELSITEAARAAHRDRRTVRRWLDDGKLPNAHQVQTPTGPAWRIPLADLLALDHVQLHAPGAGDESAPTPRQPAPVAAVDVDELGRLRGELAEALRRAEVAEARVELLERIADERAAHLADLRRLVAPLEAAPGDRRPRWWQRS